MPSRSKSRKRALSVLVVPDGGSQTVRFRLSQTGLRLLLVSVVAVALLAIAGWVSFWKNISLRRDVSKLAIENSALREDRAKVVELAQRLDEVQSLGQKVRAMFVPHVTFEPPELEIIEASVIAAPTSDPGLERVPSIKPVGDGWPTVGFRPEPEGGKSAHLGVDIAAPTGTPVRVTADGTVTFAGWDDSLGHLVVVRHSARFTTRYGHNSRRVVRHGDILRRGDVIAYVGNTGRSSGPHLHYEVREDGQPVDPRAFFP